MRIVSTLHWRNKLYSSFCYLISSARAKACRRALREDRSPSTTPTITKMITNAGIACRSHSSLRYGCRHHAGQQSILTTSAARRATHGSLSDAATCSRTDALYFVVRRMHTKRRFINSFIGPRAQMPTEVLSFCSASAPKKAEEEPPNTEERAWRSVADAGGAARVFKLWCFAICERFKGAEAQKIP